MLLIVEPSFQPYLIDIIIFSNELVKHPSFYETHSTLEKNIKISDLIHRLETLSILKNQSHMNPDGMIHI